MQAKYNSFKICIWNPEILVSKVASYYITGHSLMSSDILDVWPTMIVQYMSLIWQLVSSWCEIWNHWCDMWHHFDVEWDIIQKANMISWGHPDNDVKDMSLSR